MPYIVFCNYIRIAFLFRCALRFMISCLLGMCSFIQGVLCFIFSYPFGMLPPIRCIICFTLSGEPVMCSFMVCFIFVWSIRSAFPLPMCHIPYDVISTGMCSFILCVICFALSFGLRSFIIYGISFLLSCPPGICFIILCGLFYFVFWIRNAFYHPIWHMLYIVISTCDVSFHAMGPGFYFILCSRIAFPIRCVLCFILSCTPYVLFYPTCSMFYFTLSIRIAIFIRCVIMCHHVMSIRDMLFYSM